MASESGGESADYAGGYVVRLVGFVFEGRAGLVGTGNVCSGPIGVFVFHLVAHVSAGPICKIRTEFQAIADNV